MARQLTDAQPRFVDLMVTRLLSPLLGYGEESSE